MANFSNNNKALAFPTIFLAISLTLSTVAICSFCNCATVESKNSTLYDIPEVIDIDNTTTLTFDIQETDENNRRYMVDVISFGEDGEIKGVYSPIIDDTNISCNQ